MTSFRTVWVAVLAILLAVSTVGALVVLVPNVQPASATTSSSPDPSVATSVTDATASINTAAHLGAVNQSLIGFDGTVPSSAASLVAALHPRYIRTDVGFEGSYNGQPVYSCTTGIWNSTPLDQQVAAIKADGGTPELIVDYTPACLATPPSGSSSSAPTQYDPPDVGADQVKWDTLVEQMAYHEITAEGVRVFEVWNEPDWIFWNGGLSGYLTLYKNTAQAILQASNKAGVSVEIGGPTLANVGGTFDTYWLDNFLKFVAQNDLPLNFLSWHLYASDPDSGPMQGLPNGFCPIPAPNTSTNPCWNNPDLYTGIFETEAAQAKAALAQYPSLHPKLWIDEWNLNAESDPRMNTTYEAAFVLSSLQAAQVAGISRMCFFNVWDSGGQYNNWGVLTPSLTPKPSYDAFAWWHTLSGTLLQESSSPTQYPQSTTGGVGVIPSLSAGGTYHIALYDFTPYDPTGNYGTTLPTPTGTVVNVELTGLPSGYLPNVAIQSASSGPAILGTTTSINSADIKVILPEEGAAMLTITRKAPGTITSVTPPSGPVAGGTQVTIAGTNLSATNAVYFGSVPAASFGVISSAEITATAPSVNTPETVAISVGNPYGDSAATCADQFVYGISPPLASPAGYVPINPTRLADTRPNSGYQGAGHPLSCNSTITIQVAGEGQIPLTGVAAVILNVTAIQETTNSYVTVYPTGSTIPEVSNLNTHTDTTTANLVTVPLGSNGQVSIYNFSGSTDLVVDAEGYYIAAQSGKPPAGSEYVPLSPTRIVDTRCSASPQPSWCPPEHLPATNSSLKAILPNGVLNFTVAGIADVPLRGSADRQLGSGSRSSRRAGQGEGGRACWSAWTTTTTQQCEVRGTTSPRRLSAEPLSSLAAELNVTAIPGKTGGYLTVYPTGTSRPLASNVNFSSGGIVANQTVAQIGSSGMVSVYNSSSSSVELVVDLEGYFATNSGDFLTSSSPSRILDTRCSAVLEPSYCVSENLPVSNSSIPSASPPYSLVVQVAGDGSIPLTGVAAVVANVTVVGASSGGYLSIYPDGETRPSISNLNFTTGETTSNMAVITVAADGKIDVYSSAKGATNIVIDVLGWYSPD